MGARRLTIGAAAALLFGVAALPSQAASLTALDAHDVALYAAAFRAAEQGDKVAADQAVAQVSDPCLAGKVQYLEITHGKARTESYDELNRWLTSFADLPGANLVYELALKLKPADAKLPTPASTAASAPDSDLRLPPAREVHAAREAYFDGDVRQALEIRARRRCLDRRPRGLPARRLRRCNGLVRAAGRQSGRRGLVARRRRVLGRQSRRRGRHARSRDAVAEDRRGRAGHLLRHDRSAEAGTGRRSARPPDRRIEQRRPCSRRRRSPARPRWTAWRAPILAPTAPSR